MDEIPDGPLSMTPTFTSFPSVPEEMINSIALGLEDDLVVVSRYGMTLEEYRELEVQPWFQLKIQQLRSEFEKNGITFKAKAGWMANDLLHKVYIQASHPDAPLSQVHDVLKTLIKASGLEPKEERNAGASTSFSIQIDLGEQSVNISHMPEIIENSPKLLQK
jgi:hypothetical protein